MKGTYKCHLIHSTLKTEIWALQVLLLNLWCKSGADAAACNSSEDEVAASASYAYCLQDISLYVRILIVWHYTCQV